MMLTKFMGRETVKRPACPFCGLPVERPREPGARRPGEMPVGACTCGAVYACDETGHRIGSAMVEALVFGSDMDWELAWSLDPDEDFQQEIVEQYDYITHLVIPGRFHESRRISGVLVFVRFHSEVREVTEDGVRKKLARAKSVHPKAPYKRSRASLSKAEIERLVGAFDLEPLVQAATEEKRVLNRIQRLLYSGDELLRMRAAAALGEVSAVIAERDPGAISKLLQGLFYAVSDTAASSWGAFEAAGEIIRRRLDLYAAYIPQFYTYLSDKDRRVPVLQALAKIAVTRPGLIRKVTFYIIPLLQDPDPKVRGYAGWALGNLGAHEVLDELEQLREDTHELTIFENGFLEKRSVGQIAAEAIEKLRTPDGKA
jgi:hypothetical protein